MAVPAIVATTPSDACSPPRCAAPPCAARTASVVRAIAPRTRPPAGCPPGPVGVCSFWRRQRLAVARLLTRQLDGAGAQVDFPQQASRCAASGWGIHVGRSQRVNSAGAYLARGTTPCLALQRRRDTGGWRIPPVAAPVQHAQRCACMSRVVRHQRGTARRELARVRVVLGQTGPPKPPSSA